MLVAIDVHPHRADHDVITEHHPINLEDDQLHLLEPPALPQRLHFRFRGFEAGSGCVRWISILRRYPPSAESRACIDGWKTPRIRMSNIRGAQPRRLSFIGSAI